MKEREKTGKHSIFAITEVNTDTNTDVSADKVDYESVDGAGLQKNVSANRWQNSVFWNRLEIGFKVLWLSGSILLACYLICANIYTVAKVNKRKIGRLDSGIDVYEVEGINGLVGIFHPKIYITKEVLQDETCRRYVFLHEMQHYNCYIYTKISNP